MTDKNEWAGMKEEILQQVEKVISNYEDDDCIVENYIVAEMIQALRAERNKNTKLQKSIDSIGEANIVLESALEEERKKVADLTKTLEEIKEMDEEELLESSWSVCDLALQAVK